MAAYVDGSRPRAAAWGIALVVTTAILRRGCCRSSVAELVPGVESRVRIDGRRPVALGGLLVVALVGGLLIVRSQPAALAASSSGWSAFQHDVSGTGVDAAQARVTSVSAGWTSAALDGQVFAQPLALGGQVVVATENDSVYSLNALDGSVAWHTNLGTPVSSSSLPCGNVSPVVGISGTPVVDTSTGVVYVVAFLGGGTAPEHELFALHLAGGGVFWHRPVDAVGSNPVVENQAAALVLSQGKVYVPFGGLDGECGNFAGEVVSSAEDGTAALGTYTVPVQHSGGGIGGNNGPWPSGMTVDPATGDLLAATGPSLGATTPDLGQSVLRLTPALGLADAFTPSDAQALNNSDVELSSAPVLVGGWVFEMGQSGTGYLLKPSSLSNQAISRTLCPGASSGAVAHQGSVIFVPCASRLEAITTASDGSVSLTWNGPSGQPGTPIVTGGQVWSLYANGTLYALDQATGSVVYQTTVAKAAPASSPSSDGGHVFVAANGGVVAFNLSSVASDTDLSIAGVPANIKTDATSPSGAHVTYTPPAAVDEESGATVSCDHPSGSTFAIATTTVTCTATDADDTPASVIGTFTVTVNKAPVTIKAPSVTVTYGLVVPASFTPTYAGLFPGSTQTTTAPMCTSSARQGSPVGVYPITCSGADDPSYAISYGPGQLTIIKAATVLVASALLGTGLHPTARLTRADTGAPIPGQTVVFSVGLRTACSVQTDANGVARCGAPVIAVKGFTATYAGTVNYVPSRAVGKL